jgi:hypothetical protein
MQQCLGHVQADFDSKKQLKHSKASHLFFFRSNMVLNTSRAQSALGEVASVHESGPVCVMT